MFHNKNSGHDEYANHMGHSNGMERDETDHERYIRRKNKHEKQMKDEATHRKKKKHDKERHEVSVTKDLQKELDYEMKLSGTEDNNQALTGLEMMPMEDEEPLDVRMKVVEKKLEKFSQFMADMEREVFGASKDKKSVISEAALENFLLEGITNSGVYGCHTDLLCKFLVDAKGINMNRYFRTRVLRVLKKLVAIGKLDLNGTLYSLKK